MIYHFNTDTDKPEMWKHIIRHMKETLADVKLGICSEEELTEFCRRAIMDAQTVEKFEGALFWGFDEPKKMPSDARCLYLYQPTYLMTLTLVNIVLQYPSLMQMHGLRETLEGGLKACTGRNLKGHGFEGTEELHRNLRLFLKGNIIGFLEKYRDIGDDFGMMLDKIMVSMKHSYENGQHISDWQRNFKTEQEELIALYEKLTDMDKDVL